MGHATGNRACYVQTNSCKKLPSRHHLGERHHLWLRTDPSCDLLEGDITWYLLGCTLLWVAVLGQKYQSGLALV